jgi:DNA-binding transcriptional MerR regulator
MNKSILTREEFLAKFSLEEPSLRDWERAKLLKPAGYTDGRIPLYSEETGERTRAIQRLSELGYRIEEIHKILKKVGLPAKVEKKRKAENSAQYLTVGDLAERVGLSPRTIKHWEDKGIIEPDMRSEGGFRLYSGSTCTCVSSSATSSFRIYPRGDQGGIRLFRYFLSLQETPMLPVEVSS